MIHDDAFFLENTGERDKAWVFEQRGELFEPTKACRFEDRRLETLAMSGRVSAQGCRIGHYNRKYETSVDGMPSSGETDSHHACTETASLPCQ